MSPERSSAYQRVMNTLEQLGPSKLQAGEQDRVRYAADNLIFASALEGEAALALTDALDLCSSLVDSGRWERVTADRLAADISDCGPASEPVAVGQAA